ncbi:single-stranded DNA-binding protein [Caldimicrobium thiodismutans]|uniref:Single-stranded DNA-binding protein n=1 Tax=Caldimicrobium thiodismutans TaxID=1653476 RepID=A0A0U5AZZ9_9BACT|nr:single-stranded DNA-binding protein [Caldimicrobium thiodismutans]BAU23353.1 single-stranded DNA-binding protein [Caldimicrobium thiodismutans]
MVNKVILVGRLGADPEIRYTMDGKPVAVFRVATNEVYVKNGEKETITEWHRLVAFGRLAEICGEYLSKGSRVYIEGKLRTRKFEDKQGQTRFVTEVLVQTLQILDRRPEGMAQETSKSSFPKEGHHEFIEELPPLEEEDIPF